VIVLDTHIWLWWVHGDARLPQAHADYIQQNAATGIGVSAFSCWEVAMLDASGKFVLSDPIGLWLRQALRGSGVRVLPLSPRIAVESTRLPSPFHRDPADQIIVATARVYDCPLVTLDRKILAYPHVRTAP
jgi:PIN domain nuclease of toxin-antitoxin system